MYEMRYDRQRVKTGQISSSTILCLSFALFEVLLLAGGCSRELKAPIYSKAPIIVYDIDTLRADHLGCYGYHRRTSPNIDVFSHDAALFSWVFSQGPNTPPSQSSILTGLYPSSHGRILNKDKIAEEAVTMAEALSGGGYDCAAFVDGGLMAAGFGLEQGFDLYDDKGGGIEAILPKGLKWIKKKLRRGDTKPFLLLLHNYDVHSPYEISPWRYRQFFLESLRQMPPKSFTSQMSAVMASVWKRRNKEDPPQLSPVELDYAIAMYDGGIRHVDARFGQLLALLKETGLYDQSIIVVISDHGDTFQEHQSLFHEQIYAPVSHIPLLIHFPQNRFSGSYSTLVESIDLMPTLLEYSEIPLPGELQGRSLMPVVQKQAWKPRNAVTESPYRGRRLGISGRGFRMIFCRKTGVAELYRYRKDPLELHNLATKYPERIRALSRRLLLWQEKVGRENWKRSTQNSLKKETIEQLRKLGYLE